MSSIEELKEHPTASETESMSKTAADSSLQFPLLSINPLVSKKGLPSFRKNNSAHPTEYKNSLANADEVIGPKCGRSDADEFIRNIDEQDVFDDFDDDPPLVVQNSAPVASPPQMESQMDEGKPFHLVNSAAVKEEEKLEIEKPNTGHIEEPAIGV